MKFCYLYLALLVILKSVLAQTTTTPAKELKSKTYSYLLYLPEGYSKETFEKWPLIIYLHGKSACGNNLDKVRRYGMPFFLDRGLKLDAIAVAPQCPAGKNWVAENWFTPFLSELKEKYALDENRIYLTGMSLGGFGTFSLAIKYPDIFAAAVPLCGGGQPTTACPMKDIPTWVIHGDRDEQVPLSRSTQMVEALKKCGGNPKYTILKGQPHDIHKTYGNFELYEWMLKQSKTQITESKDINRDTTPAPLKQKESFVKRKVKRKAKKKKEEESTMEESEKLKVEFK